MRGAKKLAASAPPPRARPPIWPGAPAPAIAALCSNVLPVIVAIPPETWTPPPKAWLGPVSPDPVPVFPLPPMAWLWSNVLPLTTSIAVGPKEAPLTMAPATPRPGRVGPELSLPPIAWLWRNVLPVTVTVLILKMAPPPPVAASGPLSWLPARDTLLANKLSAMPAVAEPKLAMAPPWVLPAPLPLLPSAPRARLLRKAQRETASVAYRRWRGRRPRRHRSC